MLLWEYATAVAGRIIGINPFDQPNVEEAKKQSRALLDATGDGPAAGAAAHRRCRSQVFATNLDLGSAPRPGRCARGVLRRRAGARLRRDSGLPGPAGRRHRRRPADRRWPQTRLQTTFGWGPRFLHSTGQYHKGGHPNGVFLQITGAVGDDLAIPDRPYSFASLQAAQAAGDAKVLADKGRPVLHLHLTDRAAGLAQLL